MFNSEEANAWARMGAWHWQWWRPGFRLQQAASRDAALLLTCFGTGITVTEICRLRVRDYLTESGSVLTDSKVRAEIACSHRSRPLCWTSKKLHSDLRNEGD